MTNEQSTSWAASVAAEQSGLTRDDLLMGQLAKHRAKDLVIPREVELFVAIPCADESHDFRETNGRTVGAFFLSLRKLGDSTTNQIVTGSKSGFMKTVGCGVEDCPVSLWESMKMCNLPEYLQCVYPDKCSLVDVSMAECNNHPDVGLGEIVANALRRFCRSFQQALKTVKSTIHGKDVSRASQEALKLGSKFPGIDSKKAGLDTWRPYSVVMTLPTILLHIEGLDRNRESLNVDLMLQDLLTLMRNLHLRVRPTAVGNLSAEQDFTMKVARAKAAEAATQDRQDRRKRKELECVTSGTDDNLPPGKRIRTEISTVTIDPTCFDTLRVHIGLTDLTSRLKAERINLRETNQFRDPHVVNREKPFESVQFTRSWDRDMRCLVCDDKHQLVRSGRHLLVIVGDQHLPAVLPGCGDGKGCIPVIRYTNFDLDKIFRFVLNPVVTSMSSSKNTEEINGGLTTLLSDAIRKEVKITIGIASGTSEVNFTATFIATS